MEEVQPVVPYIHLTLKDNKTFPPSAPLWLINDLLLWLHSLLNLLGGGGGGDSFTSTLVFSPGLQIVLTHREMCHTASVCSTAVTQFRDFFTRTTSAGSKEIQQENQTQWAQLTPHAAPEPQSCSCPCWSATYTTD